MRVIVEFVKKEKKGTKAKAEARSTEGNLW